MGCVYRLQINLNGEGLMQHLFEVWEAFVSDVIAAPHVLLLSDYDGTLTPIVSRPDEAAIPVEVKEKLRILARKSSFSVGVISGRSLSEIKAMVGVEGIYYAGNHGLEIEGPGLKFVQPVAQATRSELAYIFQQLCNRLSSIRGVIVENKGLSLSVHYRLVMENQAAQVATIFREVTARWLDESKIRVSSGKKVWEVRPPVDWHKGKAVATIINEIKTRHGLERLLTVYLGDDATDEDAFAIIRRAQGWGVFVGAENPSSRADCFLNSTSEVITFLSRLIELKRGS